MMYLEDLQAEIRRYEGKIDKLEKEIQQKEDDYEDMCQAKKGLSQVEENFQRKKQQHQTVFNNALFQKNHCLQQLSAGMVGHLTGNTTSVSGGISDVESRMSKLKSELEQDYKKMDRYLNRLASYRAQARTAVSRDAVGG